MALRAKRIHSIFLFPWFSVCPRCSPCETFFLRSGQPYLDMRGPDA